jgi:hypothetical protein
MLKNVNEFLTFINVCKSFRLFLGEHFRIFFSTDTESASNFFLSALNFVHTQKILIKMLRQSKNVYLMTMSL